MGLETDPCPCNNGVKTHGFAGCGHPLPSLVAAIGRGGRAGRDGGAGKGLRRWRRGRGDGAEGGQLAKSLGLGNGVLAAGIRSTGAGCFCKITSIIKGGGGH
jgi:hypothetical protein